MSFLEELKGFKTLTAEASLVLRQASQQKLILTNKQPSILNSYTVIKVSLLLLFI